METGNKYLYHLMAIFTVIVWGITFISTKVLIYRGLAPAEIFFYRFLMAYAGMWFICRRMFADNIKDEMLLAACGLCGGSLYFVTENTALGMTLASNVSLIVCTSPVLTALMAFIIYKQENFRRNLIYGCLVAFAGVALVVFNGRFMLSVHPAGDLLTLLAALSWAFYSLILKKLSGKYPTFFITRKVFFYGLVTLCPVFIVSPLRFDPQILRLPAVWLNLLFLGLIASLLCYLLWNTAIKRLGVIRTTNYIYIVPLVTLVASSFILDEKLTPLSLLGSGMIIGGVYLSEKKQKTTKNPLCREMHGRG